MSDEFQLIEEAVDISIPPNYLLNPPLSTGGAQTEITIGDLHGNALKLLYMLFIHGIAEEISKDDYKTLVRLYQTPPEALKKIDLDTFNFILDKIKFVNPAKIRLIGDELADRGSNDYFTLKILEKLNNANYPVEIIFSNHGAAFIEAYETYAINNKFFAMSVHPDCAGSLINLQHLIDQGLVSLEEIINLVNKTYKPSLRAISYSLTTTTDPKEITLYSHAAIGLNTIKDLTEKLKLPYKAGTAEELAKTIDSINEQFQMHVQNNTVHNLYSMDEISSREDTKNSWVTIMWNKNYSQLNRPFCVNEGGVKITDYNINYVHGHHSKDPAHTPYVSVPGKSINYSQDKPQHIYNLDNLLGKGTQCNRAMYTVLFAKNQLALVESFYKPTKKEQQFISDLRSYINQCNAEAKGENNHYHAFSIFGRLDGFNAKLKIAAAEKLIKYIKQEKCYHFTFKELKALRDSRLGEILDRYEAYLPERFKQQEKAIQPPSFVYSKYGR